jgi:hypothetical protein
MRPALCVGSYVLDVLAESDSLAAFRVWACWRSLNADHLCSMTMSGDRRAWAPAAVAEKPWSALAKGIGVLVSARRAPTIEGRGRILQRSAGQEGTPRERGLFPLPVPHWTGCRWQPLSIALSRSLPPRHVLWSNEQIDE